MMARSPANWRLLQRVKNNLIYGFICLLLFLVKHQPVALTTWLGRLLGRLGYLLDIPDRRRALANLKLALGAEYSSSELKAICKASFIHIGEAAAEIITADKKRAKEPNWLTFAPKAQEYWTEALSAGHGVLAMTGHFGHWELLAKVAPELGGELLAVAKKLYDPRLTELVEDFRGTGGLKILWRERHHSLRETMLKLLQDGKIIGILNDQSIKVAGENLPFFGKLAWTPTGAATLAYKSGAKVIGVAMMRRPDGGYELQVEPILCPETSDEAQFVHSLNMNINSFYEKIIRAYPSQWMWFHNRWRPRNMAAKERREAK